MMLTDLTAFAAELCLYMSTAGFVLSLSAYSGNGGMILCTIVALLAESCCALCKDRKGVIRYLPALIMVPLLGAARSLPAVMLPLPALILILVRCQAKRWKAEYYTIRNFFKIGCPVYFMVFLTFAATDYFDRLVSDSLPFFIVWLILTILNLRLLRDQYIAGLGASFKVLNAALLFFIAFISLLLSTKPVISVAMKVITVLWSQIVVPILVILLYVLLTLLSVIVTLIEYLGVGRDLDMESFQMRSMAMENVFGDLAPEGTISFLWLVRAAIAVGVLFFMIMAWLIARKLVNYLPATSEMPEQLKRERILSIEKRPRFVRRRTAAGGIRAIYRRYLILCKPLLIPVDGSIASDVIRDKSAPYVGAENAKELRDLWLRARFSDAETHPEDTKRARQLLHQITKAAAKSKPKQSASQSNVV